MVAFVNAQPIKPWASEPSSLSFRASGLQCRMVRGPVGSWCAYVGIPKGHPLHGVRYGDEHGLLRNNKAGLLRENSAESFFNVHGQVTFSEDFPGGGGDGTTPPGLWWFGFDCAHAGDITPYPIQSPARVISEIVNAIMGPAVEGDPAYRDVDYVRAECASLASQLAAIKDATP